MEKVQVLIRKQITEACLAVDLPRSLAKRLIERLQSGGQDFLCWEVQGLVTIFLYADPNAVHEQICGSIKKKLNKAFDEIPGDTFT